MNMSNYVHETYDETVRHVETLRLPLPPGRNPRHNRALIHSENYILLQNFLTTSSRFSSSQSFSST